MMMKRPLKRLICVLLTAFLIVGATPARAPAANVAAIATTAGFLLAAIIGSVIRAAAREETNRMEIEEVHQTEREGIRARTVLAAPSALGGPGHARYASNEGYADIAVGRKGPRRGRVLLPAVDLRATWRR